MPARTALSRIALALLASSLLAACRPTEGLFADSVPASSGEVALPGLSASVQVRRDALGVPVILADNDLDLMRANGYVHAADRLAQMTSLALLAQGRLAEMAGPVAVDMDIYLRTLGLAEVARRQLEALDATHQAYFSAYAEGVNAYIDAHRERLPLEFRLSGYVPRWQAVDCLHVFMMLNLGLSLNAAEELAFLNFAQRVGPENAAWLLPTYPDEPIPLEEARKLAAHATALANTAPLQAVQQQIARALMPLGSAASNNWIVHKDHAAGGASLLANDTHLLLSQPALWSLLQTRSPSFNAAGVSLPGFPGVVIGYNGYVAWGMTMVMADNQDLFVERLRTGPDGRREYAYRGQWHPVEQRQEVIQVKGAAPVTVTVERTRHGPLIDRAVRDAPAQRLLPPRTASAPDTGLALQWTGLDIDQSIPALFDLVRARNADDAFAVAGRIEAMAFNLIVADRETIAWRITGRYPQRAAGIGHLPSPGESGAYDWTGWVRPPSLPARRNPPEGYLGTANDRKVPRDFPTVLSHTWYAPERGERVEALLKSAIDAGRKLTSEDMVAMQADLVDGLVPKMHQVLLGLNREIDAAIDALPLARERSAARATREVLHQFNGAMAADSYPAAAFGLFLHELARATFLDELGPEDSAAWKALHAVSGISYSAVQDHLLGRADSPFWDDTRTAAHEDKPAILARALARAGDYGPRVLGRAQHTLRWGQLHTYHWQSGTSELKPWLKPTERLAANLLTLHTDRGPYPAGGSPNTVNVAGYSFGEGFEVWNIPAMRMVADFSRPEPLQLTIAGGQSGNAASPHYADGIDLWRAARNRPMAFHRPALEQQYDRLLLLRAPGARGQ